MKFQNPWHALKRVTNGRTDGQPETSMPPQLLGWGIIKALLCSQHCLHYTSRGKFLSLTSK